MRKQTSPPSLRVGVALECIMKRDVMLRPWKFEASRKSRVQGPLQAACRMLSQKLSRITLKMSDFEEYEQLKKTREKEMDTSQNGGPPKSPQGPVLKIKSSRSGTVRSSTPEH